MVHGSFSNEWYLWNGFSPAYAAVLTEHRAETETEGRRTLTSFNLQRLAMQELSYTFFISFLYFLI